MYCPDCGSKSKVTDTYTQRKAVYRIRKCTVCSKLFSTRECYFNGPIPSRHSKDGKARTTTLDSPYDITCVLCGCKKCFKVGSRHVVCTNNRCSAFYIPVSRKLDKEGAREYLKEKEEKSNG